jgi:3-deoxy-D-manno-octulosonate 8-phosphate phosphatase (KDO 8-P phosphatase)
MNTLEKFHSIKAFIFDLDGVLTNHNLFVFENGQIVRQIHERDLYALERAIAAKFRIAIITGGTLKGLKPIFQSIGVKDIIEQSRDKKADYDAFKYAYDLNDEQIVYMGDEMPDYAVMRIVGLPTCPKDAAPEIKEIAQYMSPYKGGEGCVRDIVEKILRLKKAWKKE